jgi:predicted metalloprotease with PDZ domain
MKGALISACLDLYLLKLSNSQYGLRQLKHDLGIRYGKDKYFEDDSLFAVITQLTYPEISDFFGNYVTGTTPLPYERFFALAGVEYIPIEKYSDFTLGGIITNPAAANKITIGIKGMNVFGKKLGYQEGDELVSINDSAVNQINLNKRIDQLFRNINEGDLITIKVKRKNVNGVMELQTLAAPAMKVEKQRKHVLRFMNNTDPEQIQIRNAWLNDHAATKM